MKTRHWILILVTLLLAGLFVWRRRVQPQAPSWAAPPPATVSDKAVSNGAPKTGEVPSASTPKPKLMGKGEQTLEILSKLNDKEIEFYGQVVDQYGTPIPAVNVTGSVIYNNGVNSGVQEKHTVTDASGLFSFTGMKGRTFDYHLEKSGYETMPEGDAFDYTELVPEQKRHHPDPNNPVILKMWKLQGAEPLVHFEDKDFKIPPDGTPFRIDLMTGKQVQQGGDLVVTLHHETWPAGVPRKPRFDWTIQFEPNDGGAIESKQRLMYLAPESGYQPSLIVDEPASKTDWDNTIYRNIYLKSRGHLYARLKINFNADPKIERGSYLTLTWWLNPSGSRSLEYDPKKEITAKP